MHGFEIQMFQIVCDWYVAILLRCIFVILCQPATFTILIVFYVVVITIADE